MTGTGETTVENADAAGLKWLGINDRPDGKYQFKYFTDETESGVISKGLDFMNTVSKHAQIVSHHFSRHPVRHIVIFFKRNNIAVSDDKPEKGNNKLYHSFFL